MSRLNREQQRAVAARKNVVVTAGAGSGKTTVLAERYIALVEEGVPVDQILCLTFTRKAAAEMYERIYRALLDRSDRSPAAGRGVDEFEKAQISTLDSFSGRIVRNAALRFGLTPDFSVDEEELSRVMEGESLRFLIAHAEELDPLMSAKGFTGLWKEILHPLATRHCSLAHDESLTSFLPRQRRILAEATRNALEELTGVTRTIAELDPEEGKAIGDAQRILASLEMGDGNLPDEEKEALVRWIMVGEAEREVLARLAKLARLEEIGKPRGAPKKESLLLLKEQIDELRAAVGILRQIGETVATMSEALLKTLEIFRLRVLEIKRSRGLLSYQDVVELSIAALRDDLELREYYKRRFSRIMIDEFQDNNNDQRELLFLLAEANDVCAPGIPSAGELSPEKLFFVGDEKQSIYRFRGADVSVFKGLSEEIDSAGGEALELTVNYRSEPGLIDAFNALFGEVFGRAEADYDASFRRLEPRDEGNPLGSRFHLAILDGDARDPERELSNAESEARWIARAIRELLEDPEARVRDRSTGDLRRPGAGDFAVLFRSTGNQYALERVFRLYGIPYSSQSVRSLFIEAPVYDLYAFLQSVVHPEDRVAWAALLRSPFLSIGDDSVLELLLQGAEPFQGPPELVTAPEDRERYERAGALYRAVGERVDREPVTELVDYLWYDGGYRQLLLSDPINHPYLEHYDYLFQLARRYDERPMEEFLRYLRGNLGSFERIEDIELPKGEGKVELLTIHKSKGLEFPVVFLMDAGNTGRNSSSGGFFFRREEGLILDIAPDLLSERFPLRRGKRAGNYFWKREVALDELQREAELRRLLYVAATRAESHFFVTGYTHGKNKKRESRKALLHLLAEALEIDLADVTPENLPAVALDGAVTVSAIDHLSRQEYLGLFSSLPGGSASGEALYAEAPESRTPTLLKRINPSEFNGYAREAAVAEPRDEAAGPGESLGPLFAGVEVVGESSDSHEAGESERALGTLTHGLIELRIRAYREGGSAEPDPGWIAGLFRGASEEERGAYRVEAEAMAARFFEGELWERLRSAQRLETELSVLSRYDHPALGELFIQGQFDLYAETETQCEIIDFKTDRRLDPEEYRYQLSLYAYAAGELSGISPRITVFGLRDGRAAQLSPLRMGAMDELLSAYVLG